MKTSTTLLITAILVVLGCIVASNISLKQLYVSQAYKNPYRNMTFTAIKGIKRIDVDNTNLVGITILHGDREGIWISNEAAAQVQFKTAGEALHIRVSPLVDKQQPYYNKAIVVITRDLTTLDTRMTSDTRNKEDLFLPMVQTRMEGYHLKMLRLQLNTRASIALDDMTADSLVANVGNVPSDVATLDLGKGIKLGSAVFNVLGKSRLGLNSPDVTKIVYHLSDSAMVTLNGKLMR